MEYQEARWNTKKAFNQETVLEYPSFKNTKELSWNITKILWNTKKLLLNTRRPMEYQAGFMKKQADFMAHTSPMEYQEALSGIPGSFMEYQETFMAYREPCM